MQPVTAGEYAGGPEIGEVEPVMPVVEMPDAQMSRPEHGAIGDLTTATGNWSGPQGKPL